MSEVPFDPENISGPASEPLEIEKFEQFDAKILDAEEERVAEVPNGGELYLAGLGPCIGLVGYDKERKIIFGKHFLFTAPTIDEEVSSYLKHLRDNGVNPTETAIAGGNLDFEEKQRDPQYFEKMANAKKQLVQSNLTTKNFVSREEVSESTRGDDLWVHFEDGKFEIGYGEGHIEEARSQLFKED